MNFLSKNDLLLLFGSIKVEKRRFTLQPFSGYLALYSELGKDNLQMLNYSSPDAKSKFTIDAQFGTINLN